MEQRIGIGMHRLNAGRVINVRHRRNFRTRSIELVDAEKCLLFGSHGAAPEAVKIGEKTAISADHPDALVGQMILNQSLGTTSNDFSKSIVRQLAGAGSQGSQVNEYETNFLLSVVAGGEPKDQSEAMLFAQMAVTHKLAMEFARRLNLAETPQEQDRAERTLNKLLRTFTSQLEALKRYRAGREQTVNVQTVSVSEGGQAIVGNITQAPREDGPNRGGYDTNDPDAKTAPMPMMKEVGALPSQRGIAEKNEE